MKAVLRNGPGDLREPVWELDSQAWRFWLPDGSSRLTRDRQLVDMLKERYPSQHPRKKTAKSDGRRV